ncbi:MAG: transcriptional regulator [Candidatus Aenigmarchaeota archaeon]|nr:transcriptional regulator [Candidatus Aenigmarchaeota archaeon]
MNQEDNSWLSKKELNSLLELPDHLRKTELAILKAGYADAELVAGYTKRERAVESSYLNILKVMGRIEKKRVGKRTYFFVKNDNLV